MAALLGLLACLLCFVPPGNVSAPGERALASREVMPGAERFPELDLSESPALRVFREGGISALDLLRIGQAESVQSGTEGSIGEADSVGVQASEESARENTEADASNEGRGGESADFDPAELAYLEARAALARGETRLALQLLRAMDEEHPLRLAAASTLERLQRRPDPSAGSEVRANASMPGPSERRLMRAQQLYRSRRYEDARRQARALAARAKAGALYEQARMLEAESLGRLGRKHEELATLSRLLKRVGDPRIRARALYRMGLAHSILGRPGEARDHLDALITTAPEAPEAPEALRLAARASIEAFDLEGAILRYEQALEDYPSAPAAGDIALEYSQFLESIGEIQAAREVLRRADRLRLDRRAEDQRGRFLYFEARLIALHGDPAEASELFSALIARWPLSYYGTLAASRLRELDPSALKRVRDQLYWPRLRAPREPEGPSPDARAYEALGALLRLRLFDEAERFMGEMGLLGAESTRARRVYAASLFRAVDEKIRSLRILRRSYDDLEYIRFDEEGRARLRLVYPREYDGLIESAAEQSGIAPALLRAIAREESSFAPRARSRAGARGLVQIMPATGRSLAQRAGIINYTPAMLDEPETNLRLGASYLGFLKARFDGRWPLAPSAYNAGQGNVDRWLRRDELGELDLFVEAIPFSETRRYTRRVIQSYAAYAFLDEGRFIEPPLRLRPAEEQAPHEPSEAELLAAERVNEGEPDVR